MKTTFLRCVFLGVAIVVGSHAELLPSPSGDVLTSSSISTGGWFGMSVQDSGFLMGAPAGGGSRSSDDQGFASYYTASSSSTSSLEGAGSTQLTSTGVFSSAPAMVSASPAAMLAMTGATGILAETVNVTVSIATRTVAVMAPTSASAPAAMSPSSWDLSPRASGDLTYTPSSPTYSSTTYSALTPYTGTSALSPYSGSGGYSALSPLSAWMLPTAPETTSSLSPTTTTSTETSFALLNAGLTVAPSVVISSAGTMISPLFTPTGTFTPVTSPTTPTTFATPPPVTGVPEPSTWMLLGSAVAAFAARRRFARR